MEMKKADFCLLPYQNNQSTEGRIPTKLFECLTMEIPVIITPRPAWNTMIKENNAGILHDFKSKDQSLLKKLHARYYGNHMSSHYAWEQQTDKLLKTIRSLI